MKVYCGNCVSIQEMDKEPFKCPRCGYDKFITVEQYQKAITPKQKVSQTCHSCDKAWTYHMVFWNCIFCGESLKATTKATKSHEKAVTPKKETGLMSIFREFD